MGDLPSACVTPARVLSRFRVDLAGPFLDKSRESSSVKFFKLSVCLYIFIATKVIHLQVVTDFTTETLLASLK